MGTSTSTVLEHEEEVKRVPHARPPFTLGELKKAIPAHCFERSICRSFSYLFVDLAVAAAFHWAATRLIPTLPGQTLPGLAWLIYWLVQGHVWTGMWVIAHECGHHAFSEHQWVDDTVGLILHSFLLVPYFSWKLTHRRHHSNSGSLDHDELFVPKKRHTINWFTRHLMTNPLGRVAILIGFAVFGFPFYLAFNYHGRPYPRLASHFDPYSPIFTPRERAQVLASNAAVLAMLGLVAKAVRVWGLGWVFRAYFGPLVMVNVLFTVVTLLHHTHRALPRYDSSEWDWLRGALATVDRRYGFLDGVGHHIADTHVVHHLFSMIPHYHAVEATRAIKPILGDYYCFDPTPLIESIFREIKECVFVEADEHSLKKGVFWFKSLTM